MLSPPLSPCHDLIALEEESLQKFAMTESPQNQLHPSTSGVVLTNVGDSMIWRQEAVGAGVLSLSPCHDHVIGEGGGVQAEKRSTRVNPMPGTTRQLPVILHSHVTRECGHVMCIWVSCCYNNRCPSTRQLFTPRTFISIYTVSSECHCLYIPLGIVKANCLHI